VRPLRDRLHDAARWLGAVLLITVALAARPALADPLPSWNDTGPKQTIIEFVEKVTTPGSPDYVAPSERIATFDNDGTLWVEQPIYTQIQFSIDRTKELAPQHPEWKTLSPYSLALEGKNDALLETGGPGLQGIMAGPNAGLTIEEYERIVADWLGSARHPRFEKPYTDLTYQPMLELLVYLRDRGFKTFIVSGGGNEFMRVFAEDLYGIPPEQVVGSSVVLDYDIVNGAPRVTRQATVAFVDDGPGKAIGINQDIGRRPIFAFGNSDGDQQMLEWTAAGDGLRFMGLVRHTDAVREYAYDRDSLVGRLNKALDEADARKWTVVDMKNDWRRIFAFE
jgi:phosphoglycolate phosphatase-like HAD superfamily hydrolase